MFFFQAEDGIRDLVRSRGLGDVYKRQASDSLGDAPKRAKYFFMRSFFAAESELMKRILPKIFRSGPQGLSLIHI